MGATALKKSEDAFQYRVKPTGLWIDETSIIAGSADGIILSGGKELVVKIKCPFKYRNNNLFKVFKEIRGYIIIINDNDEISYNINHIYYD